MYRHSDTGNWTRSFGREFHPDKVHRIYKTKGMFYCFIIRYSLNIIIITVAHSNRVDRRMLLKLDHNRLDSGTAETKVHNNQQMDRKFFKKRGGGDTIIAIYLTLERARLAIIVFGARIVAMETFPTCRAGATAIDRIAFRSI